MKTAQAATSVRNLCRGIRTCIELLAPWRSGGVCRFRQLAAVDRYVFLPDGLRNARKMHDIYDLSAVKISRAAFCPGPPVTPPPGCVPAPQRNSPGMGVR